MKMTQNMEILAKQALTLERPSAILGTLRIPLPDMPAEAAIFVADATDEEIFPIGWVEHNGVEYQVGPLKDTAKK